MNCEHKLAWGDLRMDCELDQGHDGEHIGQLHQTKVTWLPGDRRDYTGEFVECPEQHCILPGGHGGHHAH